jgi:hypothetical protein
MIWRGSWGLFEFFPVFLFGDFRSLFLAIFLERYQGRFLGDLLGDVCMNPSWFFSLWFPSKIREKRGSIFGFSLSYDLVCSWRKSFVSSWFKEFWWTITWLRSVHELFLLSAKSCSDSWSESGDWKLDLEDLMIRGFCSSRAGQVTPAWPVLLTGLTGVSPLWDLSRVSCWIRVSLGCVGAGCVLVGFVLGSSSVQVVFWGCFCSRA